MSPELEKIKQLLESDDRDLGLQLLLQTPELGEDVVRTFEWKSVTLHYKKTDRPGRERIFSTKSGSLACKPNHAVVDYDHHVRYDRIIEIEVHEP